MDLDDDENFADDDDEMTKNQMNVNRKRSFRVKRTDRVYEQISVSYAENEFRFARANETPID